MVETEMSDIIKSNYSEIGVKEEEANIIPQKDNQIEIPMSHEQENNLNNINTNNIINTKEINGQVYSINSDQNRPITHSYIYAKLGSTHSFFADEKGNPLIIIGPHWPLWIGTTLVFSAFFFGLIFFFRKYISSTLNTIGFICYFTFLFTYSITALINPGYPKHDENSLNNIKKDRNKYCNVCKIWINNEKKTNHCNFCKICVEGMDHHCPWTGKCIGRKNIVVFFIFVFSVYGMIFYFFFVVIKARNLLNKK